MERKPLELQFLALPTAATVVYIAVMGRRPPPPQAGLMSDTLNDVAHALATVVPIYAAAEDGATPVEVPFRDLLDGQFTRSAHVLITPDGRELRNLVIQRRDMDAAATLLKGAHVKFRAG
jgi:hypothetical protein